MSNEFPRLVYKSASVHCLVADQDEREAKLSEGWFNSVPEAIALKNAEALKPKDYGAPTRAELESKAKELGLEYHHKTGDAKLLQLINEAIEKAKA